MYARIRFQKKSSVKYLIKLVQKHYTIIISMNFICTYVYYANTFKLHFILISTMCVYTYKMLCSIQNNSIRMSIVRSSKILQCLLAHKGIEKSFFFFVIYTQYNHFPTVSTCDACIIISTYRIRTLWTNGIELLININNCYRWYY